MLQFVNMQLPIRCRHSALAMHPFGLYAVQPGTLARQGAHDYATATLLLDRIGMSICGLPCSLRGSRGSEGGERALGTADARVDGLGDMWEKSAPIHHPPPCSDAA